MGGSHPPQHHHGVGGPIHGGGPIMGVSHPPQHHNGTKGVPSMGGVHPWGGSHYGGGSHPSQHHNGVGGPTHGRVPSIPTPQWHQGGPIHGGVLLWWGSHPSQHHNGTKGVPPMGGSHPPHPPRGSAAPYFARGRCWGAVGAAGGSPRLCAPLWALLWAPLWAPLCAAPPWGRCERWGW